MCSAFRSLFIALTIASGVFAQPAVLKVCADPNNLPFSNQQQQGFENKLADLIATNMNAKVEYTWWSQHKNFGKQSLNVGACDVVLGVTAGMQDVLTTTPYYRSTYVFVSRQDRGLQIKSLLDPQLATLRIGMHIVGDDFAPPAIALARQGITKNIVGFSLFGDYGEVNPPRKLIDAVASGDIDVAISWGPFAGYFAQQAKTPLVITPVTPAAFLGIPFAYDISAAVRQGNETLKAELDRILQTQSATVQRILAQYGIPQVQ
ncbi:MAG TPA: quinoprotein dehydrogenase-associated putative ABC transporter substrate-binding protein [Bryobacteraceae bacterium]|jgi:quinoprotein dehydrogenase-associated probable ABC transporter substrate-binding protein|nr:quinoprotein dehydrogenase-associated putative ABC transporter substrate-binding protein [Bryobacteraceae bacterium]